MQLELGKIFGQAWQITKANRFLWIYGLFLLWGNIFNLGFSAQNNEVNQEKFYGSDAVLWLQSHPDSAFGILFLFVLLCAVLIYAFFRARAGSILAIKDLIDKKDTSFKKSFKAGRNFYRRVLHMFILTNLALSVLSLIVIIPIIQLSSGFSAWQVGVLTILGLCILIPSTIVGSLIGIIAPLFAVLFNMNTPDAFRASFSLISECWKQLLLFGFFMFCLMILVFIISVAALSPFVVLGVLAYHKVSSTLNIPVSIALLSAGFGVFLLVQSVASIFQNTAWILMFLEIVKPEKADEEIPAPVPEIAA